MNTSNDNAYECPSGMKFNADGSSPTVSPVRKTIETSSKFAAIKEMKCV